MNKQFLQDYIILENSRVKLIPFDREEAKKLETIIFDDSLWQYMGMYVKTQADFEKYIEDILKNQGKTHYAFLIFDKKTSQFAGSTRFGNINFDSQKLEIGWTWIGKTFHGTGLNHATKKALLTYCFETIGLQRVQFSADLENLASQKAIAKLGAQKEGVFRNNYLDSFGNNRDDVYFSIIVQEWEEVKRKFFSGVE
ncbi:MAG: N-acetyltransferase [Flavobacteriaceae bacterium]|nr:MAG: N-acetyltransferase [Flavobacteriaceae bacterium]